MNRITRATAAAVALAAMSWLSPPSSAGAQDLRGEIEAIVKDYLANHPDEVGEIAKSYLIKHPKAVGQILAELLKRRSAANTTTTTPTDQNARAAARSAAVTANANLLFGSSHQVVLGDSSGDVALVEFFDYNCGFCKRALSDMQALLKDDAHLKVVLKDFPILGPDSTAAARIAIAVRMQDPDGQKYLGFHQALLGTPGLIGRDKALVAARDQNLDMARLEQDIASEEVTTTLAENLKLASAIGITGTPGYVVGNQVIQGAVGLAKLKGQIDATRGETAH